MPVNCTKLFKPVNLGQLDYSLLSYFFSYLAHAYIYEREGPSFYERWFHWTSKTPEQQLWSNVKQEIEKLFQHNVSFILCI